MLTRVRKLIAPPVFENDEETRRASALNFLLLASLPINVVASVLIVFAGGTPTGSMLASGAGLLVQVLVLFLLRRRHIQLASVSLCVGLWVIITLFSLISGGSSSPILSGYIVLVLGAGLLLGGRSGAGFAGLSVASLATMVCFEERVGLPMSGTLTPATGILLQIAYLVSAAVLLYVSMRSLGDALERARQNENAQIKANRELTAVQASLEERVADLERADKSLRDSEVLYHALVENLPQSIFLKNREGQFVFVNEHFCHGFGKTQDEIVGKTDFDFHPTELAEKYRSDDQRVMDQGTILDEVEEHALLDGETTYVQVIKTPTFDSEGQLIGIQGIFWDVTKRVQAENTLRQSHLELEKLVEARTAEIAEERNLLHMLIEVLPDYIYVKDAQSRYVLTNSAQAQLLGAKSPSDLVGKADSDYFPEELASKFYADDQAVIRSGQPLIGESEPSVDAAGHRKWTLTTKVAYRDHEGRIAGLVGLGRDITHQKQVEEELRENEARFRTLFEASPDAVMLFDPRETRWPIVDCNPVACQMNGYTREELIGQSIDMLNLTVADAEERATYLERLRSEGVLHYELNHRRKDGTLFPIEISTTLISLPDRELVLGIDRDITQRKQMEEALAQERNLLRSLIDHVPDYIYVKDTQSRFLIANPALARLIGAGSPDELLGKTDFDFFPKELAAKYYADEQVIFQSGQPSLEIEEPTVDRIGNERWVSTTKVPLRDADGKISGLVGMGREITEHKRAEMALARERTLLNTLMDKVPDFIYFKDASSRFIRTSKAHARAFGLKDPAEAVGKTDFDFFTEEHARGAYEDEQRIIRTGQPIVSLEEKETWPDRPDTWASTTKMPLRDEKGNIVGTFGISRDITERKQMEEALVKRTRELQAAYQSLKEDQEKLLVADKMASLGRLTAGIAHEMNTPLAAARASLVELNQLVKEYQNSIGDPEITPDDHREIAQEMQQALRLADGGIERTANFVRGVKTQTRELSPRERERFNAVPVIEEAVLLLSHALRKSGCTVSFEPVANLVELNGSPGRLAQVITNLVTNAIDASVPKGGGPITLQLNARNHSVELEVSDCGSGIPAESLSRIFDPMFTTKPFGQGTGLGLTIVHDIVVGDFGGTVEVTSKPGEGATFKLAFPNSEHVV